MKWCIKLYNKALHEPNSISAQGLCTYGDDQARCGEPARFSVSDHYGWRFAACDRHMLSFIHAVGERRELEIL
jgi:hypothetical protein